MIVAEIVLEFRKTAPPFEVELQLSKVKRDRETNAESVEENRVQTEDWWGIKEKRKRNFILERALFELNRVRLCFRSLIDYGILRMK
jgi:hypothetical protein